MAYTASQNHHRSRRPGKKRIGNRKPGCIYPGDLCWLRETRLVFLADVDAKGTWTHRDDIERVLYSDEPIVYVRRSHDKHGTVVHHISSLGLNYVFKGPINLFSKSGPVERAAETWK